jgi:hypothetical protein
MTPLRLPKYFDIIVLFLMIAFLKGVAQFLPFSMAKKEVPPPRGPCSTFRQGAHFTKVTDYRDFLA